MRIQRYYSDVNGIKSERNFDEPTQEQITKVLITKKLYLDHCVILGGDDNIIEVRTKINTGVHNNIYRDMYRIIK